MCVGIVRTNVGLYGAMICYLFAVADRVKKREKDREELWQKLDDLHVVAATASSAAMATATLNSKSPQQQT